MFPYKSVLKNRENLQVIGTARLELGLDNACCLVGAMKIKEV